MGQKKEEILFKTGLFFWLIMSVCLWAVGVKYLLLVLGVLCLAQGIFTKKFLGDKESVLLLAGMFIYSVGIQSSAEWIVKLTLLPFLFYYYGKSVIIMQEKSRCEQRSKGMIYALSFGLFIGSVLNAVSWHQHGFGNGREWEEFWTGYKLPATQHVFWNLLIVALIFYGIYYWKKMRFLNSVLVLGGLWSVWFSLITESRITVLIFGIVFLINIFLYSYFNWKDERKRGYIIKGLVGVAAVSVLLVVAYTLNVGGIFTSMKESYMWTRNGGILHNIRFQAQMSVLKQLFQYPFGGKQMDLAGLNYAHNVWLDMANSAGIVPFLLIVAYTVLTLYDLIRFIRDSNIGEEIKYMLVSVYVSLFLYYMVEPALDANIKLWSIWMLICGLIKGNIQNQVSIKDVGWQLTRSDDQKQL